MRHLLANLCIRLIFFSCFFSEADEIMQVHIEQAIEEINKIVKKLLTPSNELKKTIYVLDQPPESF